MNAKWNSYVKEWVEESTIHGIGKIFNKNNSLPIKCMWIVFMATSSVLSAFLIYSNFVDYLNYEINTKILIESEVPLPFPKVTICNINNFATKYSEGYLRKVHDSIGSENSTPRSILEYLPYLNAFGLPEEQQKKLGYTLKEFVISCFFAGVECDYDDFIPTYLFSYGNCFIYNSGKNVRGETIPIKNILQTGSINGLNLQLYAGSQFKNEIESSQGAAIYISNHSYSPTEYTEIIMPVGFRTKISMQRMIQIKLSKPYSNCMRNEPSESDSDLVRIVKSLGYDYSSKTCIDLCYQRFIIARCDCYDPRYTKLENVSLCEGVDQLNCGYRTYVEFLHGKFNKQCLNECPIECTKQKFALQNSMVRYPSIKSAVFDHIIGGSHKYINHNTTLEDLMSHVVMVDTYYNELGYSETSEIPKTTIVNLFCNIGGLTGLFLGMSVLSFLELIEFICESISMFSKLIV